MSKLILGRYTRQGLWSLFLMCALPLHAWTLVLAFRDLSWLADRTNAWDAVGVLSYGLLFALVESVLLFVVAALLGFLIAGCWGSELRVGVMSVLVLVFCVWAMIRQLFFLPEVRVAGPIVEFLVRSGHPVRILDSVTPAIVAATFLVPVAFIVRSSGGLRFMRTLIDRLSLLAMFYLVFDVAAVAIVVIRNI